jgi:hypothetical protein
LDKDEVGQRELSAAVIVRCAWCSRIRAAGEWRENADFEAMRLLEPVRRFSDGICPSCLARYTDRTV